MCKDTMIGVMSASGPDLKCKDLADAMLRLGINGFVTQNVTLLDGHLETGCQAHVVSQPVKANVKRLWESCAVTCDLTCAHVEIRHHEAGCIFDVLAESRCPSA